MPASQAPHGLGLHARHAQQVLRVGQVGGQLGELSVQVCLFPAGGALDLSRVYYVLYHKSARHLAPFLSPPLGQGGTGIDVRG